MNDIERLLYRIEGLDQSVRAMTDQRWSRIALLVLTATAAGLLLGFCAGLGLCCLAAEVWVR